MRLMLGAKAKVPAEALRLIRLPCWASFKYDGWRGIWQGLEFFSRNAKTIANRNLQSLAAKYQLPPGWDGEIIVGQPNRPDVFRETDSFCKKFAGSIPPGGVRFFVFDNALANGSYEDRMATIFPIAPFVEVVEQRLIERLEELESFEAEAVALGYEGICTRSLQSPYKRGRSTMNEQYLVKVKRYIDGEFQIIGAEEMMHNANPAEVSPTGYAHRSSHRDGKIPAGVLGCLVVNWNGHELRVGSGFDSKDRIDLWQRFLRGNLVGDLATIRYSPPTKDRPRQPIFKGIRGDL